MSTASFVTALGACALRYTYPGAARPALQDLTLAIEPGSFTGLLGPNGAGKTTFVGMVCGLLRPDDGELRVFDLPATSRAARASIGLCPQELALYPSLSAAENLRYFGRLAGVPRRRMAEQVERCLEIARLRDEARVHVGCFSGGMQRRLNLAAALMHEPRLLILDEPTVGIDAQSRRAIFGALEELSAGGTTIVFTTHHMEEVERLCEAVVVVDHGRVLAAGPTAELLGHGHVQAFRVRLRAGADLAELAAHAGERGVRARVVCERELELTGEDLAVLTDEISRIARRGDVEHLETHRPRLEERFLELTGEDLRD